MSGKIKRKIRIGIVVSTRMQKTIVVRVSYFLKHPRYKRIVKKYKKFKVHDEKGIAKLDDKVQIQEARPLSAQKRWILAKVLK